MSIEITNAAEPGPRWIPPRTLAQVNQAATQLGNASAMISNLELAGTPQRSAVWEAEEKVWRSRLAASVQGSPLGRQALAQRADEKIRESYDATAINIAQVREARSEL